MTADTCGSHHGQHTPARCFTSHTPSFDQHEASKPSAPNNQAIGAINPAAESTVEVPLRNRALCTALLHPDKASDVMRCALNLKPIYTEALSKALPPYSPGPSSTKTQIPMTQNQAKWTKSGAERKHLRSKE